MKGLTGHAVSTGPQQPAGTVEGIIPFVSSCPSCGHQRIQSDYTRDRLLRLLEADAKICGYCLVCNARWPIGAQERAAIAKAIAG
jgi:hypothetical protein